MLRLHPPGAPAEPHFWSGLQSQLGFRPGKQRLDGRSDKGETAQPATQAWIKRLASEMYEMYRAEVPRPELDDNARYSVVGVCGRCEWRASGAEGAEADGSGDAEACEGEQRLRLQWTQARHDSYAMSLAAEASHAA